MRNKYTNKHLAKIWAHKDLEGQLVSAYTREDAWALTKAITGKDLNVSGYTDTGHWGYRPRMLSTLEALSDILVKPEDMQ